MIRLVRELIRPYRGQLAIILLAMLVETAMSLAGPWPLKIIIDNAVGSHNDLVETMGEEAWEGGSQGKAGDVEQAKNPPIRKVQ